MEIVRVPLFDDEGGHIDYGLSAVVLRLAYGEHDRWFLWMTCPEALWLCTGHRMTPPAAIQYEPEDALWLRNSIIMFGCPQYRMFEDPLRMAVEHQSILAGVNTFTREQFSTLEPHDVAVMREFEDRVRA
jgi:hypothetical protein